LIALNETFGSDETPHPDAAVNAAVEAMRAALMEVPAQVEAAFAPEGPLSSGAGMEHRPAQAEMARAVAQTMAAQNSLLFEAGTGVGKSLAYLVPGILRACITKRPLIVSSHTIALQEQILKSELTRVRELFAQVPAWRAFADFNVALMVGRGNYLCGTRLKMAQSQQGELFPNAQQKDLARIAAWAEGEITGRLQDLDPAPDREVWEAVNADSHACNRRNCTPETCCYRRARREMDAAQLVIVNHSLLFALIGAGAVPHGKTPGILLPGDAVVLDEGHTLPNVATEHLGLGLSSYAVRRALLRLHNPRRGAKGLFQRLQTSDLDDKEAVERALTAAEVFFNEVDANVLQQQSIVRLRDPMWAEDWLSEALAEVVKRVQRRWDQLEDGPLRDEFDGARSLLNGYRMGLNEALTLGDEGHVYWAERTGRSRPLVTIRSAPLDIAPLLRAHLFARQSPLIITSATLAEGATMDTFQAKLGAEGAETVQAASPFDFARQMRVYVARDAPMPSAQNRALDQRYLAERLRACCLAVQGGTLVLFTAFSDLRAAAEAVRPAVEAAGRPFLQQGVDGPRMELVKRMRTTGNAVLFGTETFWTGVDVPGPALSQVILTRLPFENPSHPILEARAEACQQRGDNPFATLTLPAAIIKFRQGIGRLIRRRDDIGTVTILDSRILTRRYGTNFLEVLPNPHYTVLNTQDWATHFQPLEATSS